MHITNMFEKYKEWKLLRIFLTHPDQAFYTKELSRKTGIGSGTVNTFLRNIHKDTILTKEIVGNVHIYTLNNEQDLVRQLKIVNTLITFKEHQLVDQFLHQAETLITLVLYGSYATGENDSKSDIDLLLLINQKKPCISLIQQLEKKFHTTISLQVMTTVEWQKLKVKDKAFYNSILENHILLYGSGLP